MVDRAIPLKTGCRADLQSKTNRQAQKVRRNEDERMLSLLTANTAQGGGMIMILYLVLIIGFFYFFLMRPQKKEQKRVAGMLASMEIGDVICTTGGFYGVLIDITDDTVIVEFGNNKNCRIPMKKEAIADVEKAEN